MRNENQKYLIGQIHFTKGSQTKYGKRVEMILDILTTSEEHLENKSVQVIAWDKMASKVERLYRKNLVFVSIKEEKTGRFNNQAIIQVVPELLMKSNEKELSYFLN